MKNRGFTVFIIPESGGIPSVQLQLSLTMLFSFFGIGLFLLLGISYVIWDVSSSSQAQKLMNENFKLTYQFKGLKQEITALERKMDLLQVYALHVDLHNPSGPWIDDSENSDDVFAIWQKTLAGLRQQAEILTPVLLEKSEKAAQKQAKFSAIPRIWPLDGYLTSRFGYRKSPITHDWRFHSGLDIAARRGTQIQSPADGIVLRAFWNGGYGKMVEIDHGHGIKTRYGHSAQLLVSKGDAVQAGDVIATVGSTGNSTGPHLHYEILIDGVPVDPLMYMKH